MNEQGVSLYGKTMQGYEITSFKQFYQSTRPPKIIVDRHRNDDPYLKNQKWDFVHLIVYNARKPCVISKRFSPLRPMICSIKLAIEALWVDCWNPLENLEQDDEHVMPSQPMEQLSEANALSSKLFSGDWNPRRQRRDIGRDTSDAGFPSSLTKMDMLSNCTMSGPNNRRIPGPWETVPRANRSHIFAMIGLASLERPASSRSSTILSIFILTVPSETWWRKNCDISVNPANTILRGRWSEWSCHLVFALRSPYAAAKSNQTSFLLSELSLGGIT